mmetsp:Transcript_27271/g.73451  ORF Transcript_27271/g.73451 Transcript_27271/m.73451 type:complete len:436 (+) Transcript_27271:86-1393(+)
MCDVEADATVPDFWIGVTASLIGSVVLNGGLNLQRLAHMRIAARKQPERREAYCTDPLWMAGFAVFLVGNLGDAIGLTFTPQSVITPIGSISLVSNLFFARLLLGERVGVRTVVAVLLIIAGVVLIVLSADSSCSEEDIDSLLVRWRQLPFVVFAVLHIASLLLVNFGTWRAERKMKAGDGTIASLAPREAFALRLAYSLVASMWATWTVLLVKSLGEVVKTASRRGASSAATRFESYLFLTAAVISAPMQVRYLNAGLQHFESLFIVPSFYSFWVFGSITVGALFFREMDGLEAWQYGVFVTGVVLNVSGVTLIAQRDLDSRDAASAEGANRDHEGQGELPGPQYPSSGRGDGAAGGAAVAGPGDEHLASPTTPNTSRLFPSSALFVLSPSAQSSHNTAQSRGWFATIPYGKSSHGIDQSVPQSSSGPVPAGSA